MMFGRSLKKCGKKLAGQDAAVRRGDHVQDAALDALQAGQRAPAGAVSPGRRGQIAAFVADKGLGIVVQIGDHNLAQLTGTGRFAVLEHLDNQIFGRDVQALVLRAFGGDEHELPAAVCFEHGAGHGLFDNLPLLQIQGPRRR